MRIGIAGLGGVGRLHFEAARSLNEVEVTGLADPFAEDLPALAKGIRVYRNVGEMLETNPPDLVIVATPAASHAEIVEACAARRVHVLCEKPVTLSRESAIRMIDACRKAGVHLFYGASYRFIPAIAEARRQIAAGRIGDIVLMREAIIGGSGTGSHHALNAFHYPHGGPGGSGLGLVDHGIHLIDLFTWITGSGIARVFGRGNIAGAAPAAEFWAAELTNGALGLLTYADDTFPTELPGEGAFTLGAAWKFDGSPVAPGTWQSQPLSVHLHGTKGALRVHPYGHVLFLSDSTGLHQLPVPGPIPPGHFAAQIRSAAAAMAGLPSEMPTGEDGLRALTALLGAYRRETTE